MPASEPNTDPDLHTQVLDSATSAMTVAAGALDLGHRLGRYMPIEELGRGGMGLVLRAYDPRLQREVALKVLHPRAVDATNRARMVREARIMAKLGHPNVVAVYDVDDDPRHGVVLAMELVEGGTLREWLRASPRRWPEILEAFLEAGRGLAAAHAEGLLHRDFKPANVLVARERSAGAGERGRCKVTDFGLAKPEHEQGSSPSLARDSTAGTSDDLSGEALTKDGTVMGTPLYMAPEQHHGETLTSAADQFSFCVSLWGSRPRDSNTAKLHAFSCKRLGSRGFLGVCDASGVLWGLGSSAVRQETVWRRADQAPRWPPTAATSAVRVRCSRAHSSAPHRAPQLHAGFPSSV